MSDSRQLATSTVFARVLPGLAEPADERADVALYPPCYPMLEALRAGLPEGPVDMPALAREAAARLGRADAIVTVGAAALGDIDGGLYPTGTGAWMLLYREGLEADEARFLQAWLLGCHALAGTALLDGETGPVECRVPQLYRLADSEGLAARAYSFASRLLMPASACHEGLPKDADAADIRKFAVSMGVPLWHAARRWLDRTAQKAALLLDDGNQVRACWFSETACGSGLALDMARATARLRTLESPAQGGEADSGERIVPLSDWFPPEAVEPLVRPLVHQASFPITALANSTVTLLRLPRGLRARRIHGWRQYVG